MKSDQEKASRHPGLKEIHREIVQIKSLLTVILVVLLAGILLPGGILDIIRFFALFLGFGYVVLLGLDMLYKKWRPPIDDEAFERKILECMKGDLDEGAAGPTVHQTPP